MPPVAEQVRDALPGKDLASPMPHGPAGATVAGGVPFVAVTRCTGPGGPGVYRCVTVPRGADGVRLVAVTVHRDGSFAITAAFPTNRRTNLGFAGRGIRLPR